MLINDQQKFLEEGKLGMKHLDNFLKHKVKQNYKEHGIPYYLQDCINQTTNGNTEALSFPKKDRKNKTCHYCGKLGHVEKTCWKKMKDLRIVHQMVS